jgi:hypothetical protein
MKTIQLKTNLNVKSSQILSFLFEKHSHVRESIQLLVDNPEILKDMTTLHLETNSISIPFKETKEARDIVKMLRMDSVSKLPNSMLIDRDIETEGFSYQSSSSLNIDRMDIPEDLKMSVDSPGSFTKKKERSKPMIFDFRVNVGSGRNNSLSGEEELSEEYFQMNIRNNSLFDEETKEEDFQEIQFDVKI